MDWTAVCRWTALASVLPREPSATVAPRMCRWQQVRYRALLRELETVKAGGAMSPQASAEVLYQLAVSARDAREYPLAAALVERALQECPSLRAMELLEALCRRADSARMPAHGIPSASPACPDPVNA